MDEAGPARRRSAGPRGHGVSFVVPVFDKAPWLPGVLRQLARQRGDFPRQYVFVDDGSTDDSLSILKQATAGWPETTIVEQANRGPAHATNRGLAAASMAFVKLCDADDLLADGATQALRAALIRHPGAVLAYGEAAHYDGDPPALDADLSAAPVEVVARPLRRAMRNNLFVPAQCLLRTVAARASGGCDQRVPFSLEYPLALRMAVRGSFARVGATVAFRPRRATGQLSESPQRELFDTSQALAFFLDDHPDLPWHWKHYACRRAAGRAQRWARRHRPPDAGRFLALWLRAQLPILSGHGAFVRRCAQACTL